MILLALGKNDLFIAGFIASAFDFPGKQYGLSLVFYIYFLLSIRNKKTYFFSSPLSNIYVLLGY